MLHAVRHLVEVDGSSKEASAKPPGAGEAAKPATRHAARAESDR
jgi:hypothetical protein